MNKTKKDKKKKIKLSGQLIGVDTIKLSELDRYAYKMMFKYSNKNLPYNVYKEKVADAINKKAVEIAQRS